MSWLGLAFAGRSVMSAVPAGPRSWISGAADAGAGPAPGPVRATGRSVGCGKGIVVGIAGPPGARTIWWSHFTGSTRVPVRVLMAAQMATAMAGLMARTRPTR